MSSAQELSTDCLVNVREVPQSCTFSGNLVRFRNVGGLMTIDEFDDALSELGWKVSDFCRATGLHRNTPSRWRNDGVEIPVWVLKHLALLLELKRLHAQYLEQPKE
ncbi:helix-turn-helix domain-containing protein [Hydrogenophaga sp. ANAO-22]|uniref:helix-turn-helix domain-containing protein n=1 Tax=Hydrogenophaga sp. ANAO-22 TaxID=3166645 RepID=UPI0036D43433